MKKTKLKISGMHCVSCAMNIDFEVEDIKGVHQVTTSHAKEETEVTYDPDVTDVEKIIQVIAKLNYRAVKI